MTSSLGSAIYNVILAWWVTDITNSAKYFGYITAAGAVPVLIFNLFSGVLVDRKNRKHLLVIADILSGSACVAVSVVAFSGKLNIPILIVSSFIMGAASSLFGPAARAILPEIIEKENIKKCNSISSTMFSLTRVIGPMIAGFLMNNLAFGIGGAFLINGISYYVSALSETLLKYKFIPKEGKQTYIEDLKQGLSYMKRNTWLIYLLIGCASANVFLAAYNVVLPLFVKTSYPAGLSVYSTTVVFAAVGGILAGFSITLEKKKEASLNQMGYHSILQGIAFAFIQLTVSPYILYVAVLLFIFFLARFNIIFFSFIQGHVKKDMLGRVFSFIFLIALATTPVANLVIGLIGNYVIKYLYTVCGVGLVFSSLLQFKANRLFKEHQNQIEIAENIS
jgi:MFS family permease